MFIRFSVDVGKDDLLPLDPDVKCLKSVVFAWSSEILAILHKLIRIQIQKSII